MQLFWGEPLDGIRERIEQLGALSKSLDRDLPPLEFGLRITTFVRDTNEQAWAEAEARVAEMAQQNGDGARQRRWTAVGQQRLLDLQAQGEVLDDNLYTAPGKYGGGGAGTTWLVGAPADVARSLHRYRDLGVTHFVLSDTPYLREIERQASSCCRCCAAARQAERRSRPPNSRAAVAARGPRHRRSARSWPPRAGRQGESCHSELMWIKRPSSPGRKECA